MREFRNVLLVTVDCLRADRFREGIGEGLFPAFAELRDRGTSFESTFTVANTTDPSLTSFMTGAHPFAHGVLENGWGLADTWPIAAERLREAGYDTTGVVSVDHLADEHSRLGRGFDRYFDGGDRYDTLYPILSRIYDTKAFNAAFGAVKNLGVGRFTVKSLLRDLGLIQLHCRSARSVTADAIEGLDESGEPFFEWVHYFDAHEPRNAPGRFLADHDEYTAALRLVDEHVGRLLGELEERGLREDTLVILTGDHGEALHDHGYTGHGRTLYDEELHVPLVFAHDALPDSSVETQVRTIDILPTVLDLVGADPLEAAGEPLYDDGPVERDRPVYAMAYPTFRDRVAIRSGSWKLIRDRDAGTEELYDLTADPAEGSDLTAGNDQDSDSEVMERRDALAADLDEWLRGFEDADHQSIDEETEEMLADLGYRET